MQLEETGIVGCVAIRPKVLGDARGSFVKTFHATDFATAGLRTDWREEYFSRSHQGVLRGMHFQLPPADHAKLVYCLYGRVLDVVVDLRRNSPSYSRIVALELTGEEGLGLYVPTGCAHGFLSLSDDSLMLYKVTSVYAPDRDAGIAWNSFGFDWPVAEPILSPRDSSHPPMTVFDTPFHYRPSEPGR